MLRVSSLSSSRREQQHRSLLKRARAFVRSRHRLRSKVPSHLSGSYVESGHGEFFWSSQ